MVAQAELPPSAAVRILVVDDEAPLRDLLKRYLERMGYQADTCSGAEEAWERFAAAPSSYALVITDLTLPGVNGEELLGRMRATQPQLRALIVSGYPHEPFGPLTGFLQKPFLPKMLMEEIERALA